MKSSAVIMSGFFNIDLVCPLLRYGRVIDRFIGGIKVSGSLARVTFSDRAPNDGRIYTALRTWRRRLVLEAIVRIFPINL